MFLWGMSKVAGVLSTTIISRTVGCSVVCPGSVFFPPVAQVRLLCQSCNSHSMDMAWQSEQKPTCGILRLFQPRWNYEPEAKFPSRPKGKVKLPLKLQTLYYRTASSFKVSVALGGRGLFRLFGPAIEEAPCLELRWGFGV